MNTRRKLLASAAALAALLLLAGVVVWTARDRGRPSATPAGPPAASAPHSVPAPGRKADLDPASAATGLVWADFGGVLLPSAPRDGPRNRDGGTASGFARTPRGALLAAVNIGVRANAQWGPGVFEHTIGNQVIGPDQLALLSATRSFYADRRAEAGISHGEPLGPAYVVVEAFRWQAYAEEAASLDVVTAGPGDGGTTARAATRMQLQWREGDWRVLAPPGGDWGNAATPIRELSGFTVFEQG